MTYLRELPPCYSRFGRTEIIEEEINGVIKNIVKMILACGYREVEPDECIICGGFTDIRLEHHVNTFIRVVKGKTYRCGSGSR